MPIDYSRPEWECFAPGGLPHIFWPLLLVLQRGFEIWCNAAHQPCMEGGQHDGPDRDHAQDGLGDPRY